MSARPIVGIDASRAFPAERTGTETYSYQVLRALGARHPAWDYRAYVNAGEIESGALDPSVDVRAIPFARFWTHARLSWEMRRHPPDLLFVPAHVVPAIHPPSVVTIHDLGYLHVAAAHPAGQRAMLDLTTRWSVRAAREIIVPSQTTADDLSRRYHVDPASVTIIPHGVSPAFTTVSEQDQTRLRQTYRLPRPFVLSVGTIQPRKNYGRLALAVRALVDAGHDIDLVIGGREGWLAEETLAEIGRAGLGERLHLLGYVPERDLPALYATAEVFALVSLYEGFGLPALEAMATGTPVVVARGSSLPEVVGAAGSIVAPTSVNEIAGAISALLGDAGKRANHRAAGRERAAAFTWERAAVETETVFRRALSARRS